jgi:hypothetical protein
MPYQIEGLPEALKALRKISPELFKEMNKEITPVLTHMRDAARSYLPEHISGLSNWTDHVSKESATDRSRPFPPYSMAEAKKGIVFSRGRQKSNNKGWVSMYSLLNRSASGAIIETAGRLSGMGGSPDSQSNNRTNNHFTRAINSQVGQIVQFDNGRKQRGRLIYRAAHEDNGRARAAISQSLIKTFAKLQPLMGIKA